MAIISSKKGKRTYLARHIVALGKRRLCQKLQNVLLPFKNGPSNAGHANEALFDASRQNNTEFGPAKKVQTSLEIRRINFSLMKRRERKCIPSKKLQAKQSRKI